MLRKIKKPLIFILICILIYNLGIGGIYLLNTKAPSDPGNYKEFIAQLEKKAPALMKHYHAPGMALGLLEDGKVVWTKGFGMADKEKGIAMSTDSEFQAASISKSVAAWGILKLVEQGKLDLDAPAEKYLTRWHFPKSEFDNNQVTIRELLHHTAGVSLKGYAGYDPEIKLPTLEQSLNGQAPAKQAVIIKKQPGSEYKYSGGGFTVLELIVEEVSGMPFAEYMKKEVLEPLGMNNSSYEPEQRIMEKLAVPYDPLQKPMHVYRYTEKAAAGLYTTVDDLSRFASLGTGKAVDGTVILKPETLAEMKKYESYDSPFGMGYMANELKRDIHTIEHRGTNRGYRNKYFFMPESGDGMVILINSDYGRSMSIDIEAMWQRWKVGYIDRSIKKDLLLKLAVLNGVLLLSLGFLAGAYALARRIGKKERIFAGKAGKSFSWKKWLLALIPIVILGLWCTLFYTGLFYSGWIFISFVPAHFNLLTIDIILLCLLWLSWALFPKKQIDKRKAGI